MWEGKEAQGIRKTACATLMLAGVSQRMTRHNAHFRCGFRATISLFSLQHLTGAPFLK
jgi:hypothetical protein